VNVVVYHTATVPDSTLAKWNEEIERLPARKLKHWKATTIDPYGIRCQVKYSDVRTATGVNAFSHFQKRLSTQAAVESGLPVASWVPAQSISQRAEMHRFMQQVFGECRFGEKTLIEDESEAIQSGLAGILSRSTGNHKPHKTHIAIPTDAGQPVRG
jgi:hypothetical protein